LRILITGSAGFLGKCLMEHFKNQDLEVIGFDVKENPRNDISDFDAVRSFLSATEPDLIYHAAAQSFLQPGEDDPHNDARINIGGMINLLESIEKLDLDTCLVYTSTGAVYGLSPLPHREDMLCSPMCNYGISKLAAEKYLQKKSVTSGFDGKIVRFSSVYGHGRQAGPVNLFCAQAVAGGPITVYGSGSQTRDVIHVEDVAKGMERVAQRGRRGHIYNIGTGEEHSVMEIAKLIKKRKPGVEITDRRYEASPYDLPRSWFDINKALNLGWKPRIHLDLGVQMTLVDLEHST